MPAQVKDAITRHRFDTVVNWIAYLESDIEPDLALFAGSCGQYVFISSASAYQKPVSHPVITESTPLANPYWQYSRDKIAYPDCHHSIQPSVCCPMCLHQTRMVAQSHQTKPLCPQNKTLCSCFAFSFCYRSSVSAHSPGCVR